MAPFKLNTPLAAKKNETKPSVNEKKTEPKEFKSSENL